MVETTNKTINVNLKDIEGKEGINYDDYNMIKTVIDEVIVKDFGNAKDGERLVLQINTAKLNNTEVRATEFINLFRGTDGVINYSKSATSNAQKMLTYLKAEDLDSLVGKEVGTLIKLKENGNPRIGFHYGN